MRWLLQNNLVDSMTAKLAWALRRLGRPLADFSLTETAWDLERLCAPDEPHFFYGSTGMVRRLRQAPAYAANLFGTAESLDQRVWLQQRQGELLNPDVEFLTLGELRQRVTPGATPFFVRPAIVAKAFAGCVVEHGDLAPLYRGRRGRIPALKDDLLLAVSPQVTGIKAEYRFVVLDGRVRMGNRYRENGQLSVSADIAPPAAKGAELLAQGWLPSRFTIMDVAMLADNSVRLVEFNSVHSAGLYDMDPEAFVRLVEEAVVSPLR